MAQAVARAVRRGPDRPGGTRSRRAERGETPSLAGTAGAPGWRKRGRARARSRRRGDAAGPGSRRRAPDRRREAQAARWSRRPSASSAARATTARASTTIATAVGVRKQTLLYYFPTKDALLEACLAAAGRTAGAGDRRRRSRGRRPYPGSRRGRDPRGVRAWPSSGRSSRCSSARPAASARTRSTRFAGVAGSAAAARDRLPADGDGRRARSASRTRRCCCSRSTRRVVGSLTEASVLASFVGARRCADLA